MYPVNSLVMMDSQTSDFLLVMPQHHLMQVRFIFYCNMRIILEYVNFLECVLCLLELLMVNELHQLSSVQLFHDSYNDIILF